MKQKLVQSKDSRLIAAGLLWLYLQDELQRLSDEREAHGSGRQRARAARVSAADHVNLPQLNRHQEEQDGQHHGAQEGGQQRAQSHVGSVRFGSVCPPRWSGINMWDWPLLLLSFIGLASPSPPSHELVHSKFIFNCGCGSAPPTVCIGWHRLCQGPHL